MALLMAMSIEESFAPSIRAKASKWPPSSTTAIFMGTPMRAAWALAAAKMASAPSSVSFG